MQQQTKNNMKRLWRFACIAWWRYGLTSNVFLYKRFTALSFAFEAAVWNCDAELEYLGADWTGRQRFFLLTTSSPLKNSHLADRTFE